MSPTERELKYLREQGFVAEVVEKWIPQTHTRRDLFGFADIIYFDEGGVGLCQVTTVHNMPARVKKVLASDLARRWVTVANRCLLVVGWKKYAKKVDGKMWRRRCNWIFPEDFAASPDA